MSPMKMPRWLIVGFGCVALTGVVFSWAAPASPQGSLTKSRFEYRVIEVPPDTRSIQAALDEYGHAGWELVAFEMGELQAPRLIFKKGTPTLP